MQYLVNQRGQVAVRDVRVFTSEARKAKVVDRATECPIVCDVCVICRIGSDAGTEQ